MMRALPVTTGSIRQRKVPYVIAGAVLVVLGIAAIATPSVTGERIERIIGWLLLLGGIATGITTWFSGREGWRPWIGLGAALAAAVAGGMLLWSPVGGREMLSSILVGFFAASGVAKVGIALIQRDSIPTIWPWLLASGAIDIAMAIIALLRWPFDAGWFLGLMMGISLLGTGVLLIWIAVTNPKV